MYRVVVRDLNRSTTSDRDNTRPYGINDHNAVAAVRHHLYDVHADSGIMHGNIPPDLTDHATRIGQDHLAINNRPEQAPPVRRADGDEIATG